MQERSWCLADAGGGVDARIGATPTGVRREQRWWSARPSRPASAATHLLLLVAGWRVFIPCWSALWFVVQHVCACVHRPTLLAKQNCMCNHSVHAVGFCFTSASAASKEGHSRMALLQASAMMVQLMIMVCVTIGV